MNPQKIIDVITDVVDDEDVQPGFPDANGNTNVTWCNRALHRMLVMLGGKVSLILDPAGINWTNANRMVLNARANLGKITDGVVAQNLANDGRLVIAVQYNPNGPGHVALICPITSPNERPVLIGQAGKRCGIMPLRDGFGSTDVEFYKLPYETDGMSA